MLICKNQTLKNNALKNLTLKNNALKLLWENSGQFEGKILLHQWSYLNFPLWWSDVAISFSPLYWMWSGKFEGHQGDLQTFSCTFEQHFHSASTDRYFHHTSNRLKLGKFVSQRLRPKCLFNFGNCAAPYYIIYIYIYIYMQQQFNTTIIIVRSWHIYLVRPVPPCQIKLCDKDVWNSVDMNFVFLVITQTRASHTWPIIQSTKKNFFLLQRIEGGSNCCLTSSS